MSNVLSGRRLLAAALAVCLAMLTLLAAAGSAGADHDRNGGPVDGLDQAYQATRVGGEGNPQAPQETFWFHGPPPTASFDQDEPSGNAHQEQTAQPGATNVPGDPSAAYWVGDYTGAIDGQVSLQWFWASLNPIGQLIRADAIVTFYADPDMSGSPEPENIIGRGEVALTVGPDPQPNISTVTVKGEVENRLLIQVTAKFDDSGLDLRVAYDSEEFDSRFGIPEPGDTSAQVPANTQADYDGPPLKVQAAYVGRESAEPTIGVNPDGTAFFAAGAFDALPSGSPRQLARTEVLRSRDGGLEWESVQPDIAGITTEPPTTLDPYVYVEENTGRVFNLELYLGCSYMLYSDDEGETWERNEAACGSFVNDHQTIWAGPPPEGFETSDEDFPEILYYCFNRIVDANCGRSLDGGETFTPAGKPAFFGFDPEAGGLCGGLHGHIKTDSEGRLFLPKGHCGYPWIGISEDAGTTWKRVQVSDAVRAAGTHIAAAVDSEDNVYVVWWDTEERLPYLASSTDHGDTWTEPLMIAPPGVHEVQFPVVQAGDAGRVVVNFPGSTSQDQSDPIRPWNQYLVVTEDALADEPLFVSTTANPPDDPIHRGDCGPQRCPGMFDFLDVIVSPHDGDFWATATDTCTVTDDDDCVNDPAVVVTNEGQDNETRSYTPPSMEGVAIRQLSGPSLLAPQVPSDDGGDADGAGDDGSGDGAPESTSAAPVLPATGGGALPVLIGAVLLGSFALRRRS